MLSSQNFSLPSCDLLVAEGIKVEEVESDGLEQKLSNCWMLQARLLAHKDKLFLSAKVKAG
jgi:hypothetical protein